MKIYSYCRRTIPSNFLIAFYRHLNFGHYALYVFVHTAPHDAADVPNNFSFKGVGKFHVGRIELFQAREYSSRPLGFWSGQAQWA